jgi:type III secretory pathway component EscS
MSIVACTLGLFKSGFIIQLNNLSFSFVRIKIVHIKITLQLRYEFLTVELKKISD